MILNAGLQAMSAPLKAASKILGRSGAAKAARNGSKMGSASAAAAKTSGSFVAKSVGPEELFKEEYEEERATGIETYLFRQLPRPRLTERAASDLTVEQARQYSTEAKRFYDFDFSLFAGGDFFYEEVEEDFLTRALGADEDSIDKRFVDVMTAFRRALNDNTRRLILWWAPGVLAASFAIGAALAAGDIGASLFANIGASGEAVRAGASIALAVALGLVALLVVVSWPYKVVQQRNLMNLDNYVTSKFARINNNFQVAKRRALNVERDKRMSQRDELKEEAGVWTMAYQWFAMRLFLCELMIRNKFYQVRRNTALYWVGGLFLCVVVCAGAIALAMSAGAGPMVLAAVAGAGALYIVVAGALLRGAAPMMFRIIQANEWSRFHTLQLNQTVADHVGEDKVQIVTFRDRNRFE